MSRMKVASMKRWIAGSAITFAVSLLALIGVGIYTAIGRSRGEHWSSLDGPEPIWPAVVGFGAMNLIAISAIVTIVLVLIAILRAYLPRSGERK